MQEYYLDQDSYIAAARSFWAPNSRNGVMQDTRSSDGAIIRFEPSTGYVGVMQEGSISTFFRLTSQIEGVSDAQAQVTWFLNSIDGW
ncbi:hypothetical protein ACFODZ_17060 [Marinicella sediminis]|uniref:Uncharacterized protein n=1 Tax=Marinicella sediminis TaxID=1792834 RepID=A0ABV7JCW3_9GAMM|nr:hypothetical protein [Marinicella sediminis]